MKIIRKSFYLGSCAEEMRAQSNRLCVPISIVARAVWKIARHRLSKIHDPVERAKMADENIANRHRPYKKF